MIYETVGFLFLWHICVGNLSRDIWRRFLLFPDKCFKTEREISIKSQREFLTAAATDRFKLELAIGLLKVVGDGWWNFYFKSVIFIIKRLNKFRDY